MRRVEIIGGLIEHEHVGRIEQQRRQAHACGLATTQTGPVSIEPNVSQVKRVQQRFKTLGEIPLGANALDVLRRALTRRATRERGQLVRLAQTPRDGVVGIRGS